jgi:hypothetical protein
MNRDIDFKIINEYLTIASANTLSKTNKNFNILFNDRLNKYFKINCSPKPETTVFKSICEKNNNSSITYYCDSKNHTCSSSVETEYCDFCKLLLNLNINKYVWTKGLYWKKQKPRIQMCITESIHQKCAFRTHHRFKEVCNIKLDTCFDCNLKHLLWSNDRRTNYYLPIYERFHNNIKSMPLLFSDTIYDNIIHTSRDIPICSACFELAIQLFKHKYRKRYSIKKYRLKRKDRKQFVTDDNDELTTITVEEVLDGGESVIEWSNF